LLAEAACAVGRANCKDTRCCADPGMQCYQQTANYSQCRVDCPTGAPDPTHWDGSAWSCAEQGARAPGEVACKRPGQDCRASQCCQDPGMQCFEKNASWATCKAECVAGGPDLYDVDGFPWSCKKLGESAPGAAPWVASQCSNGWANCLEKKCCSNPGEVCYKNNDFFGECKALNSCGGEGWSCEKSGLVTPGAPAKGGRLNPWALAQCSKKSEGCWDSRCCLGMDVQCYEKKEGWGQCMQSCVPGVHADDNNATWSCNELGPRSYGLAIKGSPSLFCFSVIRIFGYEVSLMNTMKAKGAGIFACDGHSIMSADGTTGIGDEATVQFQGAPIVTSVDGTAGNTWLFVNAWNKMMELGEWEQHSFTAKVDPDAVFFPERLRWHLQSFLGQKIFIINCHMGDMIYGALEVFSFAAIQEWKNRHLECNTPNNYGEDKYMTQCMDHLGIARVHDESILGDKLCHTFTSCANGWNSAFHPFKDVGSWEGCWNEANAASNPAA